MNRWPATALASEERKAKDKTSALADCKLGFYLPNLVSLPHHLDYGVKHLAAAYQAFQYNTLVMHVDSDMRRIYFAVLRQALGNIIQKAFI